MGISLRTNVASLQANTSLQATNERLNSSMTKLASGLRINRAGDDAAGLAISEQFKANLKSLEQVKRNANDGVSLIQTAEGALGEVSSILIRMRELAVQAATDTISPLQRGFLEDELQQLRSEVDRIGATAEFNGLQLLSGQFATTANALTFQVDLGGDLTRQSRGDDRDGVADLARNRGRAAEQRGLGPDRAVGHRCRDPDHICPSAPPLARRRTGCRSRSNNIATAHTNMSAANVADP